MVLAVSLCVSIRYEDDMVLAVCLSVSVLGMEMMWFWLCVSLCQYPVWR